MSSFKWLYCYTSLYTKAYQIAGPEPDQIGHTNDDVGKYPFDVIKLNHTSSKSHNFSF